MKILLTGGDGFIARSLYENFHKKYSVTSLNRQKLDLFLDAPAVFDCLKKGRFDVVIHGATYDAAPKGSTKDPAKVLDHNLRMFFNVARAGEHFGKMIYFGSGAEFSRPHWKLKMAEGYFGRHVPADSYGLSKYLMTRHALSSQNIYNLRLFGVFGKYDDWRYRFISNACAKTVLDLPVSVPQNKSFDFLFMDDLARIVEWFMTRTPQHQVYNVCSGRVYRFKALAEKVLKLAGKNLDIIVKSGNDHEYSGNNALLMKEMKRFEFTPIDGAIAQTYEWYQANRRLIKKNQFHY